MGVWPGQTHLTEQRAVRPGLHLHQHPVRRPRPERQPQVPRHGHKHVVPKVPAQGAIAVETVGLGHGCGDGEKGARSQAPSGAEPPRRPRPWRPLTEPTVSAAKAHGTFAAEAAPPLCAAAVVLARVRVTKAELGLAAWGKQARGGSETRGTVRGGLGVHRDRRWPRSQPHIPSGWTWEEAAVPMPWEKLPEPVLATRGHREPADGGLSRWPPPAPGRGACLPATVPLLATKAAMSTGRPSMCRSRMQPTKSLWDTGKFSGRLGTPPRSRGPVRSRDLGVRGPGHWWDRSQGRVAPGGGGVVAGSVGAGLRGQGH